MSGHQAHPTDDDLVLHFYGESAQPAVIKIHLAACDRCAAEYEAIAETLALVPTPPIPERSDLYGLEVWHRIRPQLPAQEPLWRFAWLRWNPLLMAATASALIVAAFLTGRSWPTPAVPAASSSTSFVDVLADADQRVRLAAIADHLERSERVLLDLTNWEGPTLDVTYQQAWAADLVDANRLYRDAAAQAGDTAISSLLDDLERSLLDIVHAPSKLTPADLDDVRSRLDAAALVFKVRILSNELRERENAPPMPRKTT